MSSLKVFQVIALIVLVPLALAVLYRAFAKRRISAFLLGGALTMACVFVLEPEWTQAIARRLGIGRGADLVAYLTAFGVLGAYSLILSQSRRQRVRMTELVRAIALRDFAREHGIE